MKQILRNQVFETNSSSMHSLSILGTNNEGNLEDLNFHISFGSYEWYGEPLTTPQEILNYLWTICNSAHVDLCEPYRNKMLEWLPNCKFEKAKKVKDNYGSKPYVYYNIDGYVDHVFDWYNPEFCYFDSAQSKWVSYKLHSALDEIFESKELFMQIVFNGKIIISSDSADIFTENNYEPKEPYTHRYLCDEEKLNYEKSFVPANAIKTWVKGN